MPKIASPLDPQFVGPALDATRVGTSDALQFVSSGERTSLAELADTNLVGEILVVGYEDTPFQAVEVDAENHLLAGLIDDRWYDATSEGLALRLVAGEPEDLTGMSLEEDVLVVGYPDTAFQAVDIDADNRLIAAQIGDDWSDATSEGLVPRPGHADSAQVLGSDVPEELTLDGDGRAAMVLLPDRALIPYPEGLARAQVMGGEAHYDVIVYGANLGGILAALRLTYRGKRVALVEPTGYIGGMMAFGLVWTDKTPANLRHLITGMTDQVFNAMMDYNALAAIKVDVSVNKWTFEPKNVMACLARLVRRAGIPVFLNSPVERGGVVMDGGRILGIRAGQRYLSARGFIDASYTGDLMVQAHYSLDRKNALLGAYYATGREAESAFNEDRAGFRPEWAYSDNGYNPREGYLLQDYPGLVSGDADDYLQPFNFRLTVTDQADNMIPWPTPEGYDASRYGLLTQMIMNKGYTAFTDIVTIQPVPNGKFDLNNNAIISVDAPGLNLGYGDMTHAQRLVNAQEHADFELGLLKFISSDDLLAAVVAAGGNSTAQANAGALKANAQLYGLCQDEFVGSPFGDGVSYQMYEREVWRMRGDLVLSQVNQEFAGEEEADRTDRFPNDAVVGWKYAFRDVHARRLLKDPNNATGILSEGNLNHATDAAYDASDYYEVPARAMLPKAGTIENLAVTWCISCTSVYWAPTRMEPWGGMMGELGAELVDHCIDRNIPFQQYDPPSVQAAYRRHIAIHGDYA